MDELLPPTPTPELPAPTAPRSTNKPIVCEFCDCRLAPDGGVMTMSDKARALRDAKHDLKDAIDDLAAAQQQVATLTRERDEARARVSQPQSRGW